MKGDKSNIYSCSSCSVVLLLTTNLKFFYYLFLFIFFGVFIFNFFNFAWLCVCGVLQLKSVLSASRQLLPLVRRVLGLSTSFLNQWTPSATAPWTPRMNEWQQFPRYVASLWLTLSWCPSRKLAPLPSSLSISQYLCVCSWHLPMLIFI